MIETIFKYPSLEIRKLIIVLSGLIIRAVDHLTI